MRKLFPPLKFTLKCLFFPPLFVNSVLFCCSCEARCNVELEQCYINKVIIMVIINTVTIVSDPEKFSKLFEKKTPQSLTCNHTLIMLL